MSKHPRLALTILLPLLVGGAFLWITHVASALAPPPPTVITVDTLTDEADGSCSDGDCSLRDAIATAGTGDDIGFSVSGTIDVSTLGQVEISRSMRITAANQITITAGGANRLFKVTNGNVTFRDITLTNGQPSGLDCGSNSCGGGIYATSASITLDNVTLTGHQAAIGGALYGQVSDVTISNSRFLSNTATTFGGAYANQLGEFSVDNSLFRNNLSNGLGGAIYSSGSGGDSNQIDKSTFSNNRGGDGGAVSIINGSLFIRESTFSGNIGDDVGGAIFSNSDLRIENSTISGNTAGDQGGGIANIRIASLLNTTVTGNRSGIDGAGIASDGNSPITTTVMSSIIWGNSLTGSSAASDVGLIDGTSDTFVSEGYNLIGAAGPNVTAFNATGDQVGVTDAKLGPLQDNGGPTFTHALIVGSPAINAADENACESNDQRNTDRPQSTGCDIGAFELELEDVFIPWLTR